MAKHTITRVFLLFSIICVTYSKKRPNFLFVLTDDQDLRLGSMDVMTYMSNTGIPEAANLSNYFIHTPICCPSRSTLVTGRYVHNNKVKDHFSGGCMRMNSSRVDNPQFWERSFIKSLYRFLSLAILVKLLS